MPDFVELLLTDLEPNEPLTSEKALALYENLLAVLEAAATAPGIDFRAMNRTLAAGTTRRWYNETTRTTDTTSQEVFAFRFVQSGVVRINFQHRRVSDGQSQVSILRTPNGGSESTVQQFTTSSSSFVSRTADIAISQGDRIRIFQVNSTGLNNVEIRNIEMTTDGTMIHNSVDGSLVF